MASRLRTPAGSKLGRPVPVSSGLKPLGSVGLARPGGRSAGLQQTPTGSGSGGGSYEPIQVRTSAQKKPVGQVRQPALAGGAGRANQHLVAKPVEQATPSAPLEVGDRVLVNGEKPGVVAFLGPTQFASGTWAGIILDTFDGKNNGLVKGVQYFECEPNRGLFARPEKLKLVSKASEAASKPHVNSTDQRPPRKVEGSFNVGDQVLVDGTKPGVIAFFGPTEFARGTWAGVVLDVPEGKNNGCVAGVQYFECKPNHGLFTRSQKLTLLEKAGAGGRQEQVQPPAKQETTLRAPSQSSSQQSTPIDPAQLKALREKLKIGDRVLVGGVKEGILRFLGTTEFAKGIWAGVELEEALGKNDGAVSGKRWVEGYEIHTFSLIPSPHPVCMCVYHFIVSY